MNHKSLTDRLAETYKIRIANTNFLQFRFTLSCKDAEFILYDNTKPWSYDMYSIFFYSDYTFKITVFDKGNVKVQNFKNTKTTCRYQIYWFRWIAGLLEVGKSIFSV